MKKKFSIILAVLSTLVLTTTLLSGCGNKNTLSATTNNGKTVVKVKLNEVARSIFYAPMYAAINQGFFKDQGIEIDLTTGQGADKTMQEVISGSADIGFCGPEQVIYIYNQKRDDYPVLFAQMTQRDGSFLVGRSKETNFTWESLKGKSVLGGRPGGVPEMSFEYVLRNHGLTPGKDLNIITNVAYNATPGAFQGGLGEYVTLYEPTGSLFEKQGTGYIAASIGKDAGPLPETCYFATKSFIEKNPDIIQRFTNAIYKGQLWVASKSDKEVAAATISFFPGSDEDIMINCIKNYRAIGAYASDPVLKEENISKLMDIIQSYKADLIQSRPPYDKIVTTKFAKTAMESIK
jgi:NitT/TauT family transport system substrate-binding protein